MTSVPRPTATRNAWLVYNSNSGSHVDELEETIAAHLAEAGIDFGRSFDCQVQDLPDAAMANESGINTIIVHGGDGTINTMVKRLAGWPGAILPLPGGTANLLCHRLFDQSGWEAILDQFVADTLKPRRVDAVFCGDHMALSEMLVGPAALWADAREELRRRDVAGIVAATKEASFQSAEGPFVRIVNPTIGREEGYPGIHFSPQAGSIHIRGYAQENFVDLIKQGLAIVTHDFRQGPHDDLGQMPRVMCCSIDGSPMELMIDGERDCAPSGTEFFIGKSAVDIFCNVET